MHGHWPVCRFSFQVKKLHILLQHRKGLRIWLKGVIHLIITKTINADLWIHEWPQEVYAVQGDSYTRKITMNLFANRAPWIPEGNVSIAVRYHKPDGTNGTYDTLPNGEKAWELTDNAVSFILAPQMLTVPGRVAVQVEILCGDGILASFPLCVLVEENVAAGATRSHNYFNWVQRLEIKLKEKLKEAKESGVFDGPVGKTPELQIGTVTTLAAGSEARATITGTAEKPILNLAVPKGADAQIDTTMTVAGQAADAKAVGEALGGKAPTGYGIGENLTNSLSSAAGVDTFVVGGFKRYYDAGYTSGVAGLPDGHDFLVCNLGSSPYFLQMAVARTGTLLMVRHHRMGAWGEWEWVNPPMTLGQEYRTTERWNGKPVYTKIINAGQLPSSAQKIVELGLTNPQHLVECTVIAYSSNNYQCIFPIAGGSGLQALHYLAGWNLVLQTTRDMSEYTSCYATVKYTKTTD